MNITLAADLTGRGPPPGTNDKRTSFRSVPGGERNIPAVRINDYSHVFTLAGDKRVDIVSALERVSLTVQSGEFVSVVGASGCGKTTLLNVLAGLEPKQPGDVEVRGAEPSSGRSDIAYMFARPALLPWLSVLDNAALGIAIRGVAKRERRERALELLRRLKLSGFENAYPRQLSQGMRQRVALARTFAIDAPVMLMDEPFGALDAQTKLLLEQELLTLYESSAGRTVIFVTHDLAEAITLSDRVVIMSRRPGRIAHEIRIPLPRPRSVVELQSSSDYHELYRTIWQALMEVSGDLAADTDSIG
jgi:NitT/TauT family transport system ATP-binding protein